MTGAADAFLDTNVLVYAIDSRSDFHESARGVLDSTHRIYAISPQIVFEFFSVVTSAKQVRSPLTSEQAHSTLKLFLNRPNLRLLPMDSQAVHRALILASKHDLTRLSKLDVMSMEAWTGGLALDFGAGVGFYNYDGTSWKKLSEPDVEAIAGWTDGLAVALGAGVGLYNYDGTSWTRLSKLNVDVMEAWTGGLALDFGAGVGLYNYDGTSWKKLSNSDIENIIDVNLY